MIMTLDGFDSYGGQKPWTLNFENVPRCMNWEDYPVKTCMEAAESSIELLENPDTKILRFLRDWIGIIKSENEAPRFVIKSCRKGAFVTFREAPMVQIWFRSRRLAKVYAKKNNLSVSYETGTAQ